MHIESYLKQPVSYNATKKSCLGTFLSKFGEYFFKLLHLYGQFLQHYTRDPAWFCAGTIIGTPPMRAMLAGVTVDCGRGGGEGARGLEWA